MFRKNMLVNRTKKKYLYMSIYKSIFFIILNGEKNIFSSLQRKIAVKNNKL